MIPTMSRKEFHSLQTNELGWACLAPIMLPLRGKDPEQKSRVYQTLTANQKKLFIFYAYYNHAIHSQTEFYWWTRYYLAQSNLWTEMIDRLGDFPSPEMRDALVEIEREVRTFMQQVGDSHSLEIPIHTLETHSLFAKTIEPIYILFQEVTSRTLHRIGVQIQQHTKDFIQLVD